VASLSDQPALNLTRPQRSEQSHPETVRLPDGDEEVVMYIGIGGLILLIIILIVLF
jgi:hypothetical protein